MSATCGEPCRTSPEQVGAFGLRRAPEASGLAASRRHGDLLYVLDDGPGTTSVLAISAKDAAVVGRLEVAGLTGTDTEDLAVGRCTPAPGTCVYVGDIGDNAAARDAIEVLRFAEPAEVAGVQSVTPERVTLQYPDGPHDAEALLVDDGGTLGVVTKEPGPRKRGAARLYLANRFADAVMEDGGRVRVPQPAAAMVTAILGNVVTAGDWRPGAVVLRTYDAAFEFRSPSGRGGLETFASWPVTEVVVAAEQQGEAIAYGPDGCALFTVSEGSGTVSLARCR